jgi:hypothetical protein
MNTLTHFSGGRTSSNLAMVFNVLGVFQDGHLIVTIN